MTHYTGVEIVSAVLRMHSCTMAELSRPHPKRMQQIALRMIVGLLRDEKNMAMGTIAAMVGRVKVDTPYKTWRGMRKPRRTGAWWSVQQLIEQSRGTSIAA